MVGNFHAFPSVSQSFIFELLSAGAQKTKLWAHSQNFFFPVKAVQTFLGSLTH
jgi:hypothetical protein